MYLKLKHVLNELDIGFNGQEPLTFSFSDKQNTSVTIRPPTAEEKEKYQDNVLMCTAKTVEQPSDEIRAIFERLENNLMFEGFKKSNAGADSQDYNYIDDEGRIERNRIPPASLFPEHFQAFESQVLHKLSECITRAVKIVRWRNAINSSHNPVRFTLGLSWSFDDKHWHAMPQGLWYIIGGGLKFFFPVSDEVHDQMENLIKSNVDEPLGHELFLEAWQQQATNPRSALILAIVAAEVGFKQCVGKLVPDVEWLANSIPSPPLRKMLSEYLPLLPAKLKIQGKVLKPPKRIISAIHDGVESRDLIRKPIS